MAPQQNSGLPAVLAGSWTAGSVEALARQMGVVQRARKKNIWVLLWTVCLGFSAGSARSLTALFHTYTRLTNQTLSYSSFYAWFSPDLARFLRHLCHDALQTLPPLAHLPQGLFAAFTEVLAIDATLLRLRDVLATDYPATDPSGATAKLHLVYNVLQTSAKSVGLSDARTSDGTPWKKLGGWVRGRLLLFDLGYYDFHFFARIEDNGGFFVSRVKTTANPRIVHDFRFDPEAPLALRGKRLQEILPTLTVEVLDVGVEVTVHKRVYRGRRQTVCRRLRLVGLRRPDGSYFLYFTNLPPERLGAEDVCAVYALRWQVELFFKCLKSHLRLGDLPSGKKAVVEILVWGALLGSVVSQRLYQLVRAQVARPRHLPVLRWYALFARYAMPLLEMMVGAMRHRAPALLRQILRLAPDPNRHRPDRSLLDAPIFADQPLPTPARRPCKNTPTSSVPLPAAA